MSGMARGPDRRRTQAAAAAYAALAVADTVLAGRSGNAARRWRWLTKPALMPALGVAFRGATRRTPATGRDPWRRSGGGSRATRNATLAAQVLSWGGDVALLGSGERAFLAGLGSFFGGHVAYLAGFVAARDRAAGPLRGTGPRLALGLWAAAAPAMAVAAGRKDPRLAAPVAAYATVLATMFATSTTLEPGLPRTARRRIRAGTALFLASDAILGVREFLLDREVPALDAAVMAGYTAGQGLIAAGVAGL
jgi:uncharacterized membrane protein YhhN